MGSSTSTHLCMSLEITVMSVRDEWQAGVQNEVDFWRAVFDGKQFPAFKQDMIDRAYPEKEIEKYILPYLPTGMPITSLKLLDVAAGPISCLGWKIKGESPQITAIDALAEEYRNILNEFHVVPPVYTQPCDGENITDMYAADSFDLVHIRNALDHCYDALAVVRNMLAVLKPGGFLIVAGHTDEAVFEKYIGLHQWNIRGEDGHMIIWRPGARYDVNVLFADQLVAVEVMQVAGKRWTSITLRKK